MSYRTILVPVEQPENARSAIETAFLVARRFAGHVHGLHVQPDLEQPATHSLVATRMTASEATSEYRRFMATAEREVRHRTGELRRLFEAAAARAGAAALDSPGAAYEGSSASWEEIGGYESDLVGQLGRVFDLTVITRRGPRGSSHATVQAALLDTGRPMLLAPPEAPASVGDAVLLAWNGSPQAARAVAAAIPFLRRAARATIIAVGGGAPSARPTAEEVARALAWHGIGAQPRYVEKGQGRVRDILLAEAEAAGADLLVLGAYSHSRMRQVVLGGVTEHLLDHAEIPVLMTH